MAELRGQCEGDKWKELVRKKMKRCISLLHSTPISLSLSHSSWARDIPSIGCWSVFVDIWRFDSVMESCTQDTLSSIMPPELAGAIPLTGKKLTTKAFFLDETFVELKYDMATTVADAVEELAGLINLSAYSTFSLFERRETVAVFESPDLGNEYICLDDNKYIGDLLADFKASKDHSKGKKLTFKKRFFDESDEAVTDPIFVRLSYVQLQHDYVLGNYPVGRDDAAQLSALQILVEIGWFVSPETCTNWTSLLERFLPRQIAITRAKRDWELDILSRYRSMENLTKDDARQQFLRILRTLPYWNSVFFAVSRIVDPTELLPEKITLGINKRGVHFFCAAPKECLLSAEFRDIMQYGKNDAAVLFKMRVAGVMHTFTFETKQGKEIFIVLERHIDDVILRCYSRAHAAANG